MTHQRHHFMDGGLCHFFPYSGLLLSLSLEKIYSLQLLILILRSPHSISRVFITALLMLFPLLRAGISAFGFQRTASPSSNCSSALGALDSSSLELQCHHFLVQGLALSMHSSYLSGQKKFYNLCSQLAKVNPSCSPCPTNEWTLSLCNVPGQYSSTLNKFACCILSRASLSFYSYDEYYKELRELKVILLHAPSHYQ